LSILSLVPVDELDADATSPWFVFNDFLVTNVSEEEALSFPDDWKVCPFHHC
jgi:PAB-dependent poly(A)-specific ribonuclease subunit 2